MNNIFLFNFLFLIYALCVVLCVYSFQASSLLVNHSHTHICSFKYCILPGKHNIAKSFKFCNSFVCGILSYVSVFLSHVHSFSSCKLRIFLLTCFFKWFLLIGMLFYSDFYLKNSLTSHETQKKGHCIGWWLVSAVHIIYMYVGIRGEIEIQTGIAPVAWCISLI